MPNSSGSLAHATTEASSPQQQGLPTGPTHVASRSARTAAPGAWTPTDRWAWACGLPVSGIARAVANCIARHANDKTGLGWPGMGTIATETGFCRRAVVKAVKELERGGHVAVGRFKVGKKNKANRYQLPPMGSAPAALGGGEGSAPRALGSAPDALGGSAPRAPESVSIESVQESVKSSSRARVVCPECGNNWPAEYGTECHKCSKKPKLSTWTPADDTPTDEPTACTCGEAYRNAYGGRCVECEGKPSAAQRDALREKDGCMGVDDRVGEDGGVVRPAVPGIDAPPLEAIASTPPRAETETRQPPETRGQSPDSSVSPEHAPPDGGEPGPNARRFFADFAKWTVGKRTRLQHRADRRRLARTARKELADLAKGDA